MKLIAILTLATLGSVGVSCGQDTASGAGTTDEPAEVFSVSVTDGWSREPAAGQKVGVAYAVVENTGSEEVTIVSASSSVTDDAQLHETTMTDDGAMSMAEVPSFSVPAGDSFVFEPGGPHIMLMGIDDATYPKDTVDVTLTFSNGSSVSFDAEVRAIGGDRDDAMNHSDHGDDSDHDEHSGDDQHSGHDADKDEKGDDHTDHSDHSGHDAHGDDHGTEADEEPADESTEPLTAGELHFLDEDLTAGIFDPDTQIAVVDGYLDRLSDAAEGSLEADAVTALEALKVELETGTVETATVAAKAAHDAVHALEDHDL